jgi:hypothetical protein
MRELEASLDSCGEALLLGSGTLLPKGGVPKGGVPEDGSPKGPGAPVGMLSLTTDVAAALLLRKAGPRVAIGAVALTDWPGGAGFGKMGRPLGIGPPGTGPPAGALLMDVKFAQAMRVVFAKCKTKERLPKKEPWPFSRET